MKYEARKFNQELYNNSDKYAKERITDFLTKREHIVLEDKENFKHDLVTVKNGEKFYFEFEVKRNYPFTNKDDYSFNTVSFLGRKKRLHDIEPFYYLILCYETNSVVYCHSSDIYKDKYREVLSLSKHYRKGKDEMYRVPISSCKFFTIK